MQKRYNLPLIALLTIAVSACNSNVRHTIGLQRQVPDAFKVVSNPPLSVPPDFNLIPPQAGAPSIGENIPAQAEASLLRTAAKPTSGMSQADRALLGRAKTQEADPQITAILNAEQQNQALQEQEKNAWQRALNKLSPKASSDPTVNASKEKQRIVKNQQEGKPVTEGNVPEANKTASGGFLNRVFGL